MEHSCYITKIVTPKNKVKYYCGKHSSDNVFDSYYGSGDYIKRVKANKEYKLEKIQVVKFDTEDLAYEFEELLILSAKEKFNKRCVNIATGGIGGMKGRLPEEHPMFGKSFRQTEEAKKQISLSMKERFKTVKHHQIGRDWIVKRSSSIPWHLYDELYKVWAVDKFKRGRFNKLAASLGYPNVDYAGMVDNFKSKDNET